MYVCMCILFVVPTCRLMELCSSRPSLHFYAVDVAGNTYSNGSKKATAVGVDFPSPPLSRTHTLSALDDTHTHTHTTHTCFAFVSPNHVTRS